MTDPRLAALERESPLAVRLAELASLAVRVDAGLLRRLRRSLLPEAHPAIEADLWFSEIVESRGARGFQIAPAVLAELRTRLASEPGRPTVAEVRRVTAEAHEGVSPLIAIEERVNGLALEKGAAAAEEIEGALRPALFLISQDSADAMRVARWAQNAAARFHPDVAATTSARGLVLAAAFRLGLRPRVASAASNSPAGIADIGWAVKLSDTIEKDSVKVSFVAGGIQFGAPSAAGIAVGVPRLEPRLVEVEWIAADGPTRRLVELVEGLFVALAGDPASITLTTLAGDQYRLARSESAGGGQANRPEWVQPKEYLLDSCVQVFDADGHSPIGVAFAIDSNLWVTPRQLVDGKVRVPTNRRGLSMEVWPWGLGESDQEHDDELVPLHLDGPEATMVLELATGLADSSRSAAVAGYDGDEPHWFEIVPEARSASRGVVRAVLPKPPQVSEPELAAAFVGAPAIAGDHLIGAVLSVTGPLPGQRAAIVELVSREYLHSLIVRARAKIARARRRLTVFVSGTFTGLENERLAVNDAIATAGGQAIGMDEVEAGDVSVLDRAMQKVAQADVYLLILGNRYGVVPDSPDNPEHLSFAEIEYDRARSLAKPCLVFVRNGVSLEKSADARRMQQFKSKLLDASGHFVARFSSTSELSEQVAKALNDVKRRVAQESSRAREPEQQSQTSPNPSKLFGVPADPIPLFRRAETRRIVEGLLTTREPLPIAKVLIDRNTRSAITVISIVGPEGVGKWTLAHHAVRDVADQFADGVIWLGEDGSGYPIVTLRAYAETNGLGHIFEGDLIDRDRFREAFAPKRVLFVADQRFTSDIIPTVLLAGPDCVVLRLLPESRQDAGHVVELKPLEREESREFLNSSAGRTTAPMLLDFAEGRPLLLRLLAGAVASTSVDAVVAHLKDFGAGDDRGYTDRRVTWMIQFFARTELRALSSVVDALSAQRPALVSAIGQPECDRLSRFGIIEVHGELIRVHRQVEFAIDTVRRQYAANVS